MPMNRLYLVLVNRIWFGMLPTLNLYAIAPATRGLSDVSRNVTSPQRAGVTAPYVQGPVTSITVSLT